MVLRCVDAKILFFSIVLIYSVQIGLIVITVIREKKRQRLSFFWRKKGDYPDMAHPRFQGSPYCRVMEAHPGAVKLTLKEAQAPGAIEAYPGTIEAHTGAMETILEPSRLTLAPYRLMEPIEATLKLTVK